jgi:hypothetical protein
MIFTMISYSNVLSNSFIITVSWLKNLPYAQIMTMVRLVNNGVIGTALLTTENSTYFNRPYQFSGLQSQTNYTVNVTVSYMIFNRIITNSMNSIVTTSGSSNLFANGDMRIFIAWSVLLACIFS